MVDHVYRNWDDSIIEEWPSASPMSDFYQNKRVFLTGATGGVGQLIVQKLIRVDSGEICILVRSKKGLSAYDRMTKIFDGIIFQKAREHNPKFMEKIKIIEGDIEKKYLGMSEQDMEYVIKHTNVIFHVAADVRFDQPLKNAVFNNVRSVYDILKMCERMPNLYSFLYMSTAYSNIEPYIEEKLYKLPIEAETLIDLMESITNDENEEDMMGIFTSKIIEPWDNTYTYTKNIAEYLVSKYEGRIPAAIIRPSIIIATERDPIPGWSDNIYGLNGVMIGFGLGLLRILYCDKEFIGDVIPVDYVANATLGVAWVTAVDWKNKEKQLPVEATPRNQIQIYNCVSSPDNPQKWKEVDQILEHYRQYPVSNMFWYTVTNYTKSFFLFRFYTIVYHCLPAFFIDKYLAWKGEKVRLMKVYRLIQKNIVTASCFMQNWKFSNKNMRLAFERMTPGDHKIFPCDIRNIRWIDYNRKYCLGLRVHFGKDPLNTIDAARKRKFKLMIAHYAVVCIYYMFCAWFWYNVLGLIGLQKYLHYNYWYNYLGLEFFNQK